MALQPSERRSEKRTELDELTGGPGTEGSSAGLVQRSIESALTPGLKAKADAAVARCFYAENIPFVGLKAPTSKTCWQPWGHMAVATDLPA